MHAYVRRQYAASGQRRARYNTFDYSSKHSGTSPSPLREIEDKHLTIHGAVGSGGFATVYRGVWRGIDVAVKVIEFKDRTVAGSEKLQVGGGRWQQMGRYAHAHSYWMCSLSPPGPGHVLAPHGTPLLLVPTKERRHVKTPAVLPLQVRAMTEAAIAANIQHRNIVTTYSYDIRPVHPGEPAGAGLVGAGQSALLGIGPAAGAAAAGGQQPGGGGGRRASNRASRSSSQDGSSQAVQTWKLCLIQVRASGCVWWWAACTKQGVVLHSPGAASLTRLARVCLCRSSASWALCARRWRAGCSTRGRDSPSW